MMMRGLSQCSYHLCKLVKISHLHANVHVNMFVNMHMHDHDIVVTETNSNKIILYTQHIISASYMAHPSWHMHFHNMFDISIESS